MRRTDGVLRRTALLLALLLPLTAAAGAAGEPDRRIVAVGDVHGAFERLTEILRGAGLVDGAGAWSGGPTILVQTGDLTDRGSQVRGALDLLMELETQAPGSGGEVVALLGNHEQMNLLAIYRDAAPEAFAAFAREESEELRDRAWVEWVRWREQLAALRGEAEPELGEAQRAEWAKARPPGFFRYHEALGPEGRYGRWLRERPVAAVRGSTLFMHAGLAPEYAAWPVEELNRRHRDAVGAFDRIRRLLEERGLLHRWATFGEVADTLFALVRTEVDHGVPAPLLQSAAAEFDALQWIAEADSPLWFRGYADWPDQRLAPHVEGLLETYGVERLVAAHTPRPTATIEAKLDGRLFLIDTGMLETHYGGRPSALELVGDRVRALYPGESRTLVEGSPEPPGRVLRDSEGDPLPFSGREEILSFLRQAEVVASKPLGVGVTGAKRLVLEGPSGRDGTVRLRAVFHDIDQVRQWLRTADGTMHAFFRDSYTSQVAAYELARMMGLDQVPPTVVRRVRGSMGSVQLWIENATTWEETKEQGLSPPDPTRHDRQLADLVVFDNLIRNVDRNAGNILVDQDWNLWWIDHTRAFARDRRLVQPKAILRCSRLLWEGLLALDWEAAGERLGELLTGFEIDALLDRRDRIVALLEAKIGAQGEEQVIFELGSPAAGRVKVSYEPASPDPDGR